MSKSSKPVAEICLYGTRTVGAGWLARTVAGQFFGTGEPKAGSSYTEAVFAAVEALNAAGLTSGLVTVFDPSGSHQATFDLAGAVPYFGDLKWTAAPIYILDVQAVRDFAVTL